LRRQKSRVRWLWAGAQRQSTVGQSRNLEARYVHHEANSALWASVNALDEKHRLPIVLRYANGLSIREVADVLSIPEGTVHSRLYHARKKLALALSGTDAEALIIELFND
jgi:RNA polymerase sigma-70 factor (ECF subfamily)